MTYRASDIATPTGPRRRPAARSRAPARARRVPGQRPQLGLRRSGDRALFRLAGAARFVAASSDKVSFFGRPGASGASIRTRSTACSTRSGAAAFRSVPRASSCRGVRRTPSASTRRSAGARIGRERPLVADVPGLEAGGEALAARALRRAAARGSSPRAAPTSRSSADRTRRARPSAVARDWPAGRWTVLAGPRSVLEVGRAPPPRDALRRQRHGRDASRGGRRHAVRRDLRGARAGPQLASCTARRTSCSGATRCRARTAAWTECTVEGLRRLAAIDVHAVWTACRILLARGGRPDVSVRDRRHLSEGGGSTASSRAVAAHGGAASAIAGLTSSARRSLRTGDVDALLSGSTVSRSSI